MPHVSISFIKGFFLCSLDNNLVQIALLNYVVTSSSLWSLTSLKFWLSCPSSLKERGTSSGWLIWSVIEIYFKGGNSHHAQLHFSPLTIQGTLTTNADIDIHCRRLKLGRLMLHCVPVWRENFNLPDTHIIRFCSWKLKTDKFWSRIRQKFSTIELIRTI